MPDIFISHTHADRDLAISIADGLEKIGYTTWYYERDSIPAESHLIQTSNAINGCGAVLLIISRESLLSIEVDREVDFVSRANKHIVPALTGIAWGDFEKFEQQKENPLLQKKAQKWHMILGSIVGIVISASTMRSSLKSLQQGLESLGIIPGITIDASIVNEYPSPLASLYAGRLVGPIALQQAFQAHAGLLDAALSFVQVLSAIVAGYYRKETSSALKQDREIEDLFQKLQQPSLESWLTLLHTVLSSYSTVQEPLIQKLWAFFYGKNLKNDAVSSAVQALRKWLRQTAGSSPPFSYQDFIEMLKAYSHDNEGWLSQRAVLAPQEYQDRYQILRAALKQMLDDLAFMKDWTWIYAISAGQGDVHLFEGSGENLKPVSMRSTPGDGFKPGHIYLYKSFSDVQSLLDLYPLLSAQQCTLCNQPRTFWIRPDRQNGADLHSYSCGHTLPVPDGHMDMFHAFLSAADWERVSPPERIVPLINMLYEMMQDGELTAGERKQINTLGKALNIAPADVAYWEEKVCSEVKPQQRREELPAEVPPSLLPDEIIEEPLAPEKTNAGPGIGQPVQANANRYAPVYEIPLASPGVHAAVSGDSALLCVACEDGGISVYGVHAKLLYREQFDSRPMRLISHAQGFAAGGWDGRVSFLSKRQLEWQSELQGAVSALAGLESDLLAGTWDGQIVRLSASGRPVWTHRLEDGISALQVSEDGKTVAAGTYAGQIVVLDGQGRVGWLRNAASGIVGLAFTGNGRDLLYASADGCLARIRIDDQEVIWQEELPVPPKSLAMTGNTRRLYALGEDGKARAYSMERKLSNCETVPFESVRKYTPLPFYPDGRLALAVAAGGLVSFDENTRESELELAGNLVCFALSADGCTVCVIADRKATVLRLAGPDVTARAEPVGTLQRDRYTQLRLRVRNGGSRAASGVSVKLDGRFAFQEVRLPDELAAGAEWVYDRQSIQPLEEGALPIRLITECEDEYGLRHTREDAQVLQVEPAARR